MLVLRLLVMVLSVICLMDGHAEVSSSTTGIRNGGESPLKKANLPEVKIEDRKKKKPKKPKKKGKKKKPPKTGSSCSLKCPTGYPETSKGGSLYILRDSFTVLMTTHCANECKKNEKCTAFESTKCNKCRLLTDSKDAAISPSKQVKNYCKTVTTTTTSSPTTTMPTTISTSKPTTTPILTTATPTTTASTSDKITTKTTISSTTSSSKITSTTSSTSDCSCSDYINAKGFGQCKKGHKDFGGEMFCYVNLPSSCSDKLASKTDAGKWVSAEACKKITDNITTTTTVSSTTSSSKTTPATASTSGSSDNCYDARDKGTSSYRGTQSTTKSGRTCQKWTEKKPHSHDRTPENYPDGGLGDHNYCRRPVENGLATSPWCFTTDKKKRWEHCGIPFCQTCVANKKPCLFPFKDTDGTEYNECANNKDKFYWCATSLKSNGVYSGWEYCPEDGSCPLDGVSTTVASTIMPTTTLSSEESSSTTVSSEVSSSTTVSPEESVSTTVLIKDGENFFSCQMDFIFESASGFKMKSNFSSSCSPASSADKHYKNFDEYFFDITTSSGAKIDCKINIVIQDETSGISMAMKPMEKSLECSVDESECVTIGGEHFPTSCVVPFIHEGRKYQACTDKGGKDADKLWCATAVDENEEMTKWGYCSTACGYCGGKDVTEQDTRAGGACGYDCLINPYKPMEPKTEGIDPKLLSAPEVSYYENEMTDWNMLPNAQFQFLQGQPGVFLNCLDGFNHFPCHQSIHIKCDGNYRFSIYAAELKDDKTATIGELIQNDVKNVQIGCGPCPMGFIYKVGDEVSTYLTSAGKYNGVPDIATCRDLCNDRDCPTFVYSLEDKYCELHSVRVENPSNPVFKDYRLCTREEENSCATTPEDKCCETLTLSASGGTAQHQGHRLGTYKMDGENNNKAVYKQQDGTNVLHYYKEGNQHRWSFASSVNSGGGLSSKLGDDSVCPNDVKIWQYYLPGTTNDWFEDSTVAVKCEEGSTCDKTRAGEPDLRWELQDCPYGYQKYIDAEPLYTFMDWTKEGGEYTKQECADLCKGACRAFIYSSPCNKCKLLTDKQYAEDKTKSENMYCLKLPGGAFCTLTRSKPQLQCPVYDAASIPPQTDIKFVSRKPYALWTFQKATANAHIPDNSHNLCSVLCAQHEQPHCIGFTYDQNCGGCKLLKKDPPTADEMMTALSAGPGAFNSEEMDTFCLIDICPLNIALPNAAPGCNCGIQKCNTPNYYCSEDYECIQGNFPSQSLTIKALNENNLHHKIWRSIAAFADGCRDEYNKIQAKAGRAPLTDEHQYGYYVYGPAAIVANDVTMTWLAHFHNTKKNCRPNAGYFAVLYKDRTSGTLVHIEPQLIDRINNKIAAAGTGAGTLANYEWFILTVNSPCAGRNVAGGFNQHTCAYRTMDEANTLNVHGSRLNVGFRHWWIPGKFEGITWTQNNGIFDKTQCLVSNHVSLNEDECKRDCELLSTRCNAINVKVGNGAGCEFVKCSQPIPVPAKMRNGYQSFQKQQTALITCDQSRTHWCTRINFYRTTIPGVAGITNVVGLTSNNLRYFLFKDNCGGDLQWRPANTC